MGDLLSRSSQGSGFFRDGKFRLRSPGVALRPVFWASAPWQLAGTLDP